MNEGLCAMNILLGICGFGNGHAVRQAVLLDVLMSRGHKVMLFTFGQSSVLFQQERPSVPQARVWIAWKKADASGLCFTDIANDPRNVNEHVCRINFTAMAAAHNFFGSAPDLVISDYEPISAQFAYACGSPLVTIDNQSLMLGYKTPRIGLYGPEEDRARLRMYFPQADERLVISYFHPSWHPDPKYPVTLISPILRNSLTSQAIDCSYRKRQRNLVLVYWSPFASVDEKLKSVLAVLSSCTQIQFKFYSCFGEQRTKGNIEFREFNMSAFVSDLASCTGVITTAGAGMITELLYLGVPILALPVATYEQNLNAVLVETLGVGMARQSLERQDIMEFIDRADAMARRISAAKKSGELPNLSNGIEDILSSKLFRDLGV